MKSLLSVTVLSLVCWLAQAQLTLEKDYPLEDIRYFHITDEEGVYANYSSYSDSAYILLFDDDQQLIRSVRALDDTLLNVINVSKYLVNEDDLFEIIYTYHTIEGGQSHYNTQIIDENSNLLEGLEDQYLWIQNTAGGPKLLSQQGSRVYSLPGINYPVRKGERGEEGLRGAAGERGLKGDPGPAGPQGEKGEKGDPYQQIYYAECDCNLSLSYLPLDESILLSEPFPNPAYEASMINYNVSSISEDAYLVVFDLKGVKRLSIHLSPEQRSLEIPRSLLGNGTYFLRVEEPGGSSPLRMLIFE